MAHTGRPLRHLGGRGFSLIECLVAVVVASLGALAIGKLQLRLHAQAATTRQWLEAAHLAQQKIEQLRALPYASLAAGADSPPLLANTSYVRWWSSEPSPTGAAYAQITVNVSWSDRTGSADTFSLTTLVARADSANAARLRLQGLPASADAARPVRHADIPLLAVVNDNGTSTLTSARTVTIYDNLTGAVISICSLDSPHQSPSPTPGQCEPPAPTLPPT